jgi:predicted Zn-ribbon and HTH transcriptional regulator
VAWEQYQDLKRLYEELKRIKEDLREELAVIMLRRVVPGRCKYCPV